MGVWNTRTPGTVSTEEDATSPQAPGVVVPEDPNFSSGTDWETVTVEAGQEVDVEMDSKDQKVFEIEALASAFDLRLTTANAAAGARATVLMNLTAAEGWVFRIFLGASETADLQVSPYADIATKLAAEYLYDGTAWERVNAYYID